MRKPNEGLFDLLEHEHAHQRVSMSRYIVISTALVLGRGQARECGRARARARDCPPVDGANVGAGFVERVPLHFQPAARQGTTPGEPHASTSAGRGGAVRARRRSAADRRGGQPDA